MYRRGRGEVRLAEKKIKIFFSTTAVLKILIKSAPESTLGPLVTALADDELTYALHRRLYRVPAVVRTLYANLSRRKHSSESRNDW